MKEKYYLIAFIFHFLIQTYNSIFTCPTSYVALPYGLQSYCAKCDTTCLTCSDQGMNNCVTCPTDFTYNSNTSYCIPPNTKQIKTIQSSYKFLYFTELDGWSGGTPQTDSTYGPTIYRGTSLITKTFTITPTHYKIRILVSVWLTYVSGTYPSTTDYIKVQLKLTDGTLYKTFPTISNIPLAAQTTYYSGGHIIYPPYHRATNIDLQFSNSYKDTANIQFTSNYPNFGIRQFILIQYLCNTTACSRCDGSTNMSCLECTDTAKRAITSLFPQQCLCDSDKYYFQHPDWDYCVKPCPNRIGQQYYGDKLTKKCTLICSGSNYFADPVTGTCETICSASIKLGNVVRTLYKDYTNKRCVTICPTTEPYFDNDDFTCYNVCRTGRYQNPRTMECVVDCPSWQLVPLFGEGIKCVEQCIGSDNWGDFRTHKCTNQCSNGTGVNNIYFQDNSTGRNLCVRVCPFPTLFGDLITDPSQPYCDQICPSGYYGDYVDPRHCVSQCTQETNQAYFGLKVQSRQCVKICPQGSWAQTTNFTCLLTEAQCNLDNNKYADNDTWTCVLKGQCSKGRYTEDTGHNCVITCPNGTYANQISRHCQTGCSGQYFADPGINRCVKICQTQNLFADIDSGNMCVQECNQAGSTPFRDFTTKTCVDKCPVNKKLFADSIAKSCVYNCTPGTYSYDNIWFDATDDNKTCLTECPDPYFADNSTGYGKCIIRCPQDKPLFGDVIGTARLCVAVCQSGKFGDQDTNNGRLCQNICPQGWFAQNDDLRRCVKRCNSSTYGYQKVCYFPSNCPNLWVGDPSTNLCVQICPIAQGTFSDLQDTRTCVSRCPIINQVIYYADPTKRWCVDTCNESHNLFGNNLTQTCQQKCIDRDSYADFIHPNRYCIAQCTDDGTTLYYKNNFTKKCVISTDCPEKYFADNTTKFCVMKCPMIQNNTIQTWGHKSTQTCVQICYDSLWGDTSTGIPLCVPLCPSVPAKWSYDPQMICVTQCPFPLFGEDFTRTCTLHCPNKSNIIPYQTFAYNGTHRCLRICAQLTFGDYKTGQCYQNPEWCTYGWGDDYNNSCVHKCTGPIPWDSFGDNTTWLCTVNCTEGLYADEYTGTRECVPVCPGAYDNFGNVTGPYDSFGDNDTNRCVQRCMNPLFYADWQTHKCQQRCSGDIDQNATNYDPNAIQPIPTYANLNTKRCVISLACPQLPDKLFGDNRTRTCLTTCYNDQLQIQWADNLTRTCIPQCYHINDTNVYAYDTRFYGDISSGNPQCVIKCPTSPRMFGQNNTNLCVSLCPDNTYGDQVNNRSCTADCYEWDGIIYYSQITQRICVKYCEDGTYANWHNRHCETVPTDCIAVEFANDGNNSCVALCPQELNYFGDPTTKKCVARCPTLIDWVINTTANINQQPGYFYADYKTRLCVRICPQDFGLQGTFGDNFTNTCVQRCPFGSFGDDQSMQRTCVATCTNSNFGDTLTQLCVKVCPSSPPYFGYQGNWTCLNSCPTDLWADEQTRLCVSICPNNAYRLSSHRRQCVDVCPTNPDLYGDDLSKNCQSTCTQGQYADPTDRKCKYSCLPLFQYNFRCLKLCPSGYFANSTGDCVIPQACDSLNQYAQNATTKCVQRCTGGSFADPNSKYCIAICPVGWYGDQDTCVQQCVSPGTSISQITQTCVSICPNYTYHQNGTCKQKCQIGYANDLLGKCYQSCPLTPKRLFANPLNHDCVQTCPQFYVRDLDTGFCVEMQNGCSNNKFADYITGNCQSRCSSGLWGNRQNLTCIQQCLEFQYGYQSATERTCYQPLQVTVGNLYADPQTHTFVPVCQSTPKLYFADTIDNLCVQQCIQHDTTEYYGDPNTRKCQSSCNNATFYTADPLKDKCVLKCTLGTFRYNNSGDPICVSICPQGYADSSTRICVEICPIQANTFGFANLSSGVRICLQTCPENYYARPDPLQRTCQLTCDSSLYADNTTHKCVDHCLDSFADDSNFRCMDKCNSNLYPSADNSTNKCVSKCPQKPDYYNENHICVFYCTQVGYFADSSTRQCVDRCPNITIAATGKIQNTYGDLLTGRCVKQCPQGYWGDNQTNQCTKTCSLNTYAENLTRLCVAQCPANQNLYADPFLKMCAYTCSNGYFGSQVTHKCIHTCQDGATQSQKYWGDPLTTMCVNICPQSIYFYGQNMTRKCASSCVPSTTYGFADNYTRICRDKCQNYTIPRTFADPTSSSCVRICPNLYYAQNTTVQCRQICLTGFADNYSRYCVETCPEDPQSYGDTNLANNAKICVYSCMNGFSDNSTNLCVPKCPEIPDLYGDPHTNKCVYLCTQGTYAQNDTRQCMPTCPSDSFADNYTRRCVQICPTSTEWTYRDFDNWKCVRVCPDNRWAQNKTQMCVDDCPSYIGMQTYEDNISKYCVKTCPYPYFGRNDTHECVLQCSVLRTLYGHHQGRVCVLPSDCFKVPGKEYFSDPISGQCVQTCPQTLWADSLIYKCVSDCDPVNTINKIQYRNLNNQKCVSICPSNPQQFADDISGSCVATCPPGSYAYQQPGFRKCVAWCGTYGMYDDQSTNRCVNICPTQPYMYADINVYKCVDSCQPSGWFADNKTQTCVVRCPADWQLFGERLNYTCVQLCPDGYFADVINNRECNLQCPSNQFADNFTSKCVDHCFQIRKFYYQDTSTGTGLCVFECPFDSYGYNINQQCMYQNPVDLSSTCPGQFYADRSSKQCVKICPQSTYANIDTKYCQKTCFDLYFADNATRKCRQTCSGNYFALIVNSSYQICVQFCPAPYYAQNSSKSCVQGCSSLFALDQTRTCQSYCPQPYFADINDKQCKLNCSPIFADNNLRKCLDKCNFPTFSNPLTMTCDLLCPDGYFGKNDTRSCQQTCLPDTFADPSTRLCVKICPEYPLLFADDSNNQCVQVCEGRFGYQQTRVCVDFCPNISKTINGQIIDLIYLADSSNNLCVLQCINQLISFADYEHNQCTIRCPQGTFANNFTKQCVPQCPTVPNDTFAQNTSNICLDKCPLNTYGSSQNLHCVTDCWWPNFQDDTTQLCVQQCPEGYFAQNQTAQCVKKCMPGTYADPTTKRCVADCPLMHDLFKYDQNWTCVYKCPSLYYSDDTLRSCKKICQQTGMYAYNVTQECVRECPIPYRAFDQNNTCILTCPYLYFYNSTRNKCTKCPIECLICTDPTSCLKCATGYNLFNGICDISCQPQNGIVTYSNPSGICVRICPTLWYGDNSTYSCKQICPTKLFGSNDTQLCENCPQTCASCLSLTQCITCQADSSLAIDKMCYRDCNTTHKYQYNNTCYNICPLGTYITYTQVTCGICSSNCYTCEGNAMNCTSCNGRYYFNNLCLSQCPQKYYGNTNFICELCTSSILACSEPLKFTTKVVVEEFKYVVYVKFNQVVSIEKQIEDLLKIRLKLQRRLLSTADLINNGIKYTYSVQSDGTIKLILVIDQNLISPEFIVQILDPTAIKSKTNGGSLQNTQNQIKLQKVQYYSKQDGAQAQTNIAARFTVIFILLLYGITFFWTDSVIKSLQFIQIILFHATLNVSLPASVFYYFYQFKRSILQFLPNFFIINTNLSLYQTQFNYNKQSQIQRIIDIFQDYNFIKNIGQIMFVLVVFLFMWLIFNFLSNRKLIQNKLWRNFFEDIFKRRFKYMAINDVLSVFYLPILWFCFMQFKNNNIQGNYTKLQITNPLFTIVFFLIALVVPFIWLFMWLKFQPQKFNIECSFMCKRIRPLELSYQIYSENQNQKISQQQLKQQKSQKLNQKDNNNQNNNKSINKSKYQLQTLITYAYLFLLSLWLVSLYQHQTAQLIMLIITNLSYLSFILYFRPYISIVNNILIPIFICQIIFIECYMLHFNLNDSLLSTTYKIQQAKPLLITISVFYMIMILWTIWRVIWDFMHTLNYFKKTQFYLIYGDPQHINEQEKSQNYQTYQRKAQIIDQALGDTFIQKIYKQVNQHGDSIIRVKKKVLKKKKKIQGRKKKNFKNNQNSEENSINGELQKLKQSSIDSDNQYIRINKPTPFEYTNILDKPNKQSQNYYVIKNTFKAIDDDIRDKQQEQIDYQKLYALKNKSINQKTYKKKNEIKVQEQEKSVHQIQQIMNEQSLKEEQQKLEEFQFISSINEKQSDLQKQNILNNEPSINVRNNNKIEQKYSQIINNEKKKIQESVLDEQNVINKYMKYQINNKQQPYNLLQESQSQKLSQMKKQKVSQINMQEQIQENVTNKFKMNKQNIINYQKQNIQKDNYKELKNQISMKRQNDEIKIKNLFEQQSSVIDNGQNQFNMFDLSKPLKDKKLQKQKEKQKESKNKVQIFDLQDLILEEQKNKNKKLMFLFDEQQEQDQN